MNAYDLHNYGDKVEKIFANPKLVPRIEKDRTAKEWTPEGFINADPSPTYIYLDWIIKSYIDGGIKLYEDVISRVKPALKDYMYLVSSGKLELGNKPWENERNIVNYCGLAGCKQKGFEKAGLDTLLNKYSNDLEARHEKQLETQEVLENSEVVFEDDNVKVIWPKTEKASCYYGQGTKWCTAATEADNMFDEYNKNGKLYVVIPKNPKYVGEKYQLHIETNSAMDEEDEPVRVEVLFDEDYPSLNNYEPFKKFKMNAIFLHACKYGNVDIVKESLLNVNPTINNYQCIYDASRKGHIEVVKVLLKDERIFDEYGIMYDAVAAAHKKYPEISKLIIDAISQH